MRVAAVIPARLKSTRLENKIILDVGGKPLIERVYDQITKANQIADIFIATDSQEIVAVCERFTDNIILTGTHHKSGTDRIVEALASIEHEGIINVQGDEPLIDPELLNQLALGLKENIPVLSAMHRIKHTEELFNPNNVKVVTDIKLDALYFSRSVIPYEMENWETLRHSSDLPQDKRFYKHIGVYAFQRDLLKAFSGWPVSRLESSEKLEQLRLLDNGYKIRMIETDYECVGVDTSEDLKQVRQIFEDRTK